MRYWEIVCVFSLFTALCLAEDVNFCYYCGGSCEGDSTCTSYASETCFAVTSLCTGITLNNLYGYILVQTDGSGNVDYILTTYTTEADCQAQQNALPAITSACGACLLELNGYVKCPSHAGLIIGISVAAVLVVCCCVAVLGVVAFVLLQKKKANFQMYQNE